MSTESVFSNRGEFSGNNFPNALDFIVRSIVKGMLNTAIVVRVDEVFKPEGNEDVAGYVKVTPLVMPRDPQNQSIPTTAIPKIPFFRNFAGRCAIVCDPVPGDIGYAIFAQQDMSLIKPGAKEPQPAASFRCFDMSDGVYFGGILGGGGDTSIVFDQNGNITLNAPDSLTINCTTANINASDSVNIETPETNISGNLNVKGAINSDGDTVSGGISLQTHVHGGVQGGPSTTGAPQ